MHLLVEMSILVVALLIAQYAAASEDNELLAWRSFKTAFADNYRGLSQAQESVRKQIFLDNVKRINEFNADPSKSFKQGVTRFTDLSHEEFKSKYTGLRSLSSIKRVISDPPKSGIVKRSPSDSLLTTSYPNSLNYQNTAYVSAVKDQGSCGCYWAFAASGAVEGQTMKLMSKMISPSEQQFVDCAKNGNNNGCGGGNQAYAFVYMSNGIMSASAYPYTAVGGSCRADASKFETSTYSAVTSDDGINIIGSYTDDTIIDYGSFYLVDDSGNGDSNSTFASAVIKVLNEAGPLAIEFCVDSQFQNYRSGVYDASACLDSQIDHAMLLVGYDISSSDSAQKYWIIKNSWGSSSWGMSGYAYVRYGAGLIRYPSYPKINTNFKPTNVSTDSTGKSSASRLHSAPATVSWWLLALAFATYALFNL